MVFGVDPHKRVHGVAALDGLGRVGERRLFGSSAAAHAELLSWARGLAPGDASGRLFAIEGAGHFGRPLARFLIAAGERVVDVPAKLTHAERAALRGMGKDDLRDAVAVARIAAREQFHPLGTLDGPCRDLKVLSDYRRQLVKERSRWQQRVHRDLAQLVPDYAQTVGTLRRVRDRKAALALVVADDSLQAQVARAKLERIAVFDAEIRELDRTLRGLVEQIGTRLVTLPGISYLSAARILGEVRDVARYPSKDHFARANGTAPIPASSGATHRFRLNRGGNRQLNYAIHVMALTQARVDERARAYLDRKRGAGASWNEAIRSLKRHLSDVVYQQLRADALLLDAQRRPAMIRCGPAAA